MTRKLRNSLMCTAVLALVVLTARPGQAQNGAERPGRREAGHGRARDGRPSEDDGGHESIAEEAR